MEFLERMVHQVLKNRLINGSITYAHQRRKVHQEKWGPKAYLGALGSTEFHGFLNQVLQVLLAYLGHLVPLVHRVGKENVVCQEN